jgi:hypothetical protein
MFAYLRSRDGRIAVSGSADGTLLVHPKAQLAVKREETDGETDAEDIARTWIDFNRSGGMRMQEAFERLALFGKSTVRFLRTRLTPTPPADPHELTRLIEALNSDRYAEREQASSQLEGYAELAEPALRKALEKPASAEVKHRIQELLAKLDRLPLSGAQLQAVRVTALLERIGSRDARDLLKKLATSAPAARLTLEAKASLDRLQLREAR